MGEEILVEKINMKVIVTIETSVIAVGTTKVCLFKDGTGLWGGLLSGGHRRTR